MVSSCSSLNLGLGFSLLEKGDANSVVPEVLGQALWIQLRELSPFSITPSPFSSCSFLLPVFPQESFPARSCSGRLGLDLGCWMLDPFPSLSCLQELNPPEPLVGVMSSTC